MTNIHLQLNEADAVAAYRLYWRIVMRRRRMHILLPLMIIVVSLLYGTGYGTGTIQTIATVAAVAGIAVALITLMFLIVQLILVPRRARRSFRQNYMLREDMLLTVDDEALHSVQASAKGQRPWRTFLAWAENGSVLLLLSTDQLFFFIPRRVLSAEDLDGIRSKLARAGVPQARALPLPGG